MNKQKKELRQRQSTRQLMGISQLTQHGIRTSEGELVFYLIKPDNLSVLSEDGVRGRVMALTRLLCTMPQIQMLALDSRESFRRNKDWYRLRLEQEELPAIRELLRQDSIHLDNIQAGTASAREFAIVICPERSGGETDENYLRQTEKRIRDLGFQVRLAYTQDIKRLLAVYYQQDVRKINRIQFLSGNSLKVIAVLTMLIDHLCKIVLQWLLSNYWGAMADNGQMSWERFREIDYFIRFDLQSIGTIAFPLFCFLLAEGFQHTRSKKRYIGLMLAFALISEVPFDIGFFSAYSRMEDTFPFYLKYQNVFFTLFLGLLTLVCLERFSCKSDLPVDRIKSAVLQVLSVVLFSGIAEGIHCDYGMQGILFISAFYICRNHRIYQVLLFLLAYMGTTGNQPPLCTLLACLLILLYNGKRGKLKLKYFFYVFYPAHILVLYLIQIGLGKYLLK